MTKGIATAGGGGAPDTSSALKSGPVLVLLPFFEGPQTGPVPEIFRMQELWTRTAKKTQKTSQNWL